MEQKIGKRVKGIAYLLMLVYFASYLMRINFAVMMVKICSDMDAAKSDLAIVVTGMTIFYGIGQIVNGFLGDRIRPNRMLNCGLILAAACNIGMFFCRTIPLMTAVWCVNGFAHAMLWPPIVRLLSAHLTDAEYSYAAVRVCWGSSLGTIFLYALCPVFLRFMSWRWIIFCLAVIGIGIAAVWMLCYPRLFGGSQSQKQSAPLLSEQEQRTVPLPRTVWLPVALIFIGIILQGILRDGVTNWMPSYMAESFHMPEENAIFSTVILAIFSMISFSVFDQLHCRLFRNEVTCAAVIFTGSAVSAAILYTVSRFASSVVASMLLMALIVSCMHGINLMLITVVPKRFIKSGKVATFSGFLNAGTQLGSALSTYGFAVLAEKFGWSFTILMWVIVSAAGAVVCFATVPMWKRFRREYSDT